MDLTPGDKFDDRYQLLFKLGEGGMGDVWKALDARLDRSVALKFSKTGFTARFEREARMIAALNHPNIGQIYDVGPNYLVMEFIDGAPIKGPLSVEKAVEYASQILDGLDAAHQKGITHRDLKPANILVTKHGIKLLDFGLAKKAARSSDATPTALTAQGQIVGTPQYMAPEQSSGEGSDARSDIFSFGCVLYEMLMGKRAFDRLGQAPEPIEIAPPLDFVIRTCLARDPGKRFQSAAEARRALDLGTAPEPRRPGSLGPAQPFFMQEGLLKILIGTVMKIEDQTIVPTLPAEVIKDVEGLAKFVDTTDLAHVCGRINADAFRWQRWYGTANDKENARVRRRNNVLEKTKRNYLHYKKNPNTLLLLRSFPISGFTPADHYIGFSHVIPLTDVGYQRYRRGEIRDNTLLDDAICGVGEEAKAILLFSIAVDAMRSVRLAYKGVPHHIYNSGELGYQIGLWLLRSLSYHVQKVMSLHDHGHVVTLLAQNDNALIRALEMASFRETADTSGDGLRIWSAVGKRADL